MSVGSSATADSPNSGASCNGNGDQPQQQQPPGFASVASVTTVHIPHSTSTGGGATYRTQNAFSASASEGAAAVAAMHHHQQAAAAASFYGATGSVMGAAYGPGASNGSPGMYVKLGGAFFAHHVSVGSLVFLINAFLDMVLMNNFLLNMPYDSKNKLVIKNIEF